MDGSGFTQSGEQGEPGPRTRGRGPYSEPPHPTPTRNEEEEVFVPSGERNVSVSYTLISPGGP